MIDLYNGDCLEVMDKLIEKNIKVDSIITDIPYGTTNCSWDSIIPFDEMWLRLNKLIKPNGAIVLFGSEPFSSALRMSNIDDYKYDWKWNKKQGGNPLNSKIQPLKIHEDIMIFNKHNYNPIMRVGKMRTKGGVNKQPLQVGDIDVTYPSYKNNLYFPTSILEITNADRTNRVHPTQKPIKLMEYLIKTYTNENETILDFTMGSGSTLVACKNLNRKGIGIELDKGYFKIAQKRVNEAIKGSSLEILEDINLDEF